MAVVDARPLLGGHRRPVARTLPPAVPALAAAVPLWACATWLVLAGAPAWLTLPAHVLAALLLHVVVQEAAHHAVSRRTWVNELAGRVAAPLHCVQAAFPLLKHVHLRRHRGGDDPLADPGRWTATGPRWLLPLRWLTVDLWMGVHYLRRAGRRPLAESGEGTLVFALVLAGSGLAVVSGFGAELALAVLLPQRIALAVLASGSPRALSPAGCRFYRTPESAAFGPWRRYAVVAAGAGIVPVLPALERMLAGGCRITLLNANTSGATAPLAGRLSELALRHDGRLRVLHYRSDEQDPDLHAHQRARPADVFGAAVGLRDTPVERYLPGRLTAGRLATLLAGRLHPAKVDAWLVCAPPGLAATVRAVLVERGVAAGTIHGDAEQFARGR
ncbi:hypothetical protein [Amycolatopsis suaedae]|uniref:FAD-binding FR-type domain-containing protein n=1 Tax=Amycolatopsis suaedae TaxID=2510978 RepID=A0A4Q7J3A1_9PSEU|nr:hypothetical protein [Amycolatopsis suaedae]RZQ60454.1 hypothetical protein EWH70_29615 [Amycolatopsis suaedae]